MPITTWIRDLIGIPKDFVDLKKSKLEVTKLEAEERQRNLISPVTLDDVRKYDLNVQRLVHKIKRQGKRGKGIVVLDERRRVTIRNPTAVPLLILIMIVGVIIATIIAIVVAIRSVLN